MKFQKLLSLLCLTIFTSLNIPSIEAGKITGFDWTDGIVSIAGIVPPISVNENNDDVADGDPLVNEIMILQKDYRGVEHIDIIFYVEDTLGVTEYTFIEGVQNSSGFNWESYHIQLGFGTGDDFVLSPPGDGLDFDAPLYNSTIQFDPPVTFSFPDVTMSEDVISADGGPGQIDGQYNEPFIFAVDVPDGIESFTLRQFPVATIPEPASLGMLFLGTALLASRRH